MKNKKQSEQLILFKIKNMVLEAMNQIVSMSQRKNAADSHLVTE